MKKLQINSHQELTFNVKLWSKWPKYSSQVKIIDYQTNNSETLLTNYIHKDVKYILHRFEVLLALIRSLISVKNKGMPLTKILKTALAEKMFVSHTDFEAKSYRKSNLKKMF